MKRAARALAERKVSSRAPAMDPDLRAVADAVAGDAAAGAALVRLVAKSGNGALQCQMLYHVADGMAARPGLPEPEASPAPASPEDSEFARDLEYWLSSGDGRPEEEERRGGGDGEYDREDGDGEYGREDDGREDGGREDGGREEERGAKRARGAEEGDMVRYLDRPTKILKTMYKFYDRYGDAEVTRNALADFMESESDVLQRSSANKLFHPPKGFRVAFFVRKGSFVRLAKEWLDAMESKGRSARGPDAPP